MGDDLGDIDAMLEESYKNKEVKISERQHVLFQILYFNYINKGLTSKLAFKTSCFLLL